MDRPENILLLYALEFGTVRCPLCVSTEKLLTSLVSEYSFGTISLYLLFLPFSSVCWALISCSGTLSSFLLKQVLPIFDRARTTTAAIILAAMTQTAMTGALDLDFLHFNNQSVVRIWQSVSHGRLPKELLESLSIYELVFHSLLFFPDDPGDFLGGGGFGTVFSFTSKADNKKYAVKFVFYDKKDLTNDFYLSFHVVRLLDSTYLVHYFDNFLESAESVRHFFCDTMKQSLPSNKTHAGVFMMELCPDGTLKPPSEGSQTQPRPKEARFLSSNFIVTLFILLLFSP